MSTTEPEPPGAPDPQQHPQGAHQRRNPWIWISALLAVVAVGLGVWAYSAQSDLDSTQQDVEKLQAQVDQSKETGGTVLATVKAAFQDLAAQVGATNEDLANTKQQLQDAQAKRREGGAGRGRGGQGLDGGGAGQGAGGAVEGNRRRRLREGLRRGVRRPVRRRQRARAGRHRQAAAPGHLGDLQDLASGLLAGVTRTRPCGPTARRSRSGRAP